MVWVIRPKPGRMVVMGGKHGEVRGGRGEAGTRLARLKWLRAEIFEESLAGKQNRSLKIVWRSHYHFLSIYPEEGSRQVSTGSVVPTDLFIYLFS